MITPRKLALAAVASGVLLAGCGSGSGSDSAPSATKSTGSAAPPSAATTAAPTTASGKACDIVSDEAVTAVLGVTIVRREAGGKPAAGSPSCIKGLKRSKDPKEFTFVSVGIVAGGASVAKARAASVKGATKVAGLGDGAYFLGSAGVLYVIDGADLLQAQVVKGGVPGSQSDCTTIAKDVLSRRS